MTYSKYLIILLAPICLGCYSHKKSVESSLPHSQDIYWPEKYQPEDARFFVHNEIDIEASPQVVWDILVNAENWPNWYKGATDVVVQDSPSGQLRESSVFTWKTMGMDFTTTIKEYKPPYRLSWESNKKSISGYHAWLIIPTSQGCKLITDESQYGWLTFMQKSFIPNKLRKLHGTWLSEIKNKAELQTSKQTKDD